MRTLLWCCLLLAAGPGLAQNGTPPVGGARSMGMGGVGLTFTDIHAIWGNAAGLAHLPGFSAAAFGEQRFMSQAVRQVNLAAAQPLGFGSLGLSAGYFGFADYQESRLGLAYGRKLFERLAIGAQFLALNTSIPEYGNALQLTFEVGLLAQISPELQMGCKIFSPARVEVLADEYVPTLLSIGLGYQPGDQLSMFAEVEKDIQFPTRVRAGLEYNLLEQVSLRLGVATQPTLMSFGAGYRLGERLQLDVAAHYHQFLGFSPGVAIVLR